jgi:hypothetical protein
MALTGLWAIAALPCGFSVIRALDAGTAVAVSPP